MREEQEWAEVERQWAELEAKFPQFQLPRPECWSGWFGIIERLLGELREIAPEGLKVHQVKEKLAGLRFYCDGRGDSDDNRIALAVFAAECRAARTCEICGVPGLRRLGRGGWLSTRCDAHAPAKSAPTHPAEEQRAWRPEMRSNRKGQPDSFWRYDPARDAVVAVMEDEEDHPIAWGSGDVWQDLGLPNQEDDR
ncbi:MAG: hypothetical protein AB7I79_03055 [Rhizobiaceae bacterium]